VRTDEVGNVIASRPGYAGGPRIAVVAHLDTVFPAGTDVTVRVEGDRYYAPGIGDNVRGLVMLLELARAIVASGIQTRGEVLLIGDVGEEGLGDLRGVRHLFREGAPPIDALIAIDGGRRDDIVYGAIGSARFRVSFHGPGGHSWGAFGLANPHHALGRSIDLFTRRAQGLTATGPRSSFNVGRIGGGTSINAIAFESWMEVDMRSGDRQRLDLLVTALREALYEALAQENAARRRGDALTVRIDSVGQRPAGTGDPASALVSDAAAALAHVGFEPALVSSSTDANIPISLGIPAVTMSRGGISRRAHSLEESWEDRDTHRSTQAVLLTLLAQSGVHED
jgi:acetylornithine deacetylase/succinyl-diaminopimelate desuccinylase-like protein